MKSLSFYLAVFVCGFRLAGCDGEESVSGIDQAPNAITDDSAEAEGVVLGNDGPSRPVSLRWIDMIPGDTASTDRLALQVTSLSEQDYQVGARLLCNGLINKDAAVELGERELAAGEAVTFTVDAEDLPIQTTSGAAQARFELLLSRETEAGTSERRMLTTITYYRHDAGYSGLQVFDEKALMEQHNGKLSGVGAGLSEAGQLLGRVANGTGGFDDVKLMDDEFAIRQGGEIIGWESGMDISIGSDDEIEEVAK